MTKKTVEILNISFINQTRQQVIQDLSKAIQQQQKQFVVTANPEIVMMANQQADYMAQIKKADLVTADGIGVVKAANLLGTPLPERVTGFELMIDLLQVANEEAYSIYLLGAADETLQKTICQIEKDYPRLQIVGSHHGFFDWSQDTIPSEIERLQPDLVFVALGAPRQEKWIGQHIDRFQKGVFIGIGGSFDVIAGTVKRAPVFWQKIHLEWLYRILKQPSRLKRSFAIPQFMWRIQQEKRKVKR